MTLARVEALVGFICALILAVLPVLGNMDFQSTAGIIGGLIAVVGIVTTRLQGWQKWENNPVVLKELTADPTDTKTHSHVGNDVDREAF